MKKTENRRKSWVSSLLIGVCTLVLSVGMAASAEETESVTTETQDAGAQEINITTEETEMETQETEESEKAGEAVSGSILPNGESVYNLLLIGSDRRNDSWNGNSDVMIVATVNLEQEKILMTSYMRDLYADIPGYGVHKLNYAFAVGGAGTLEETLEDNYDISIDNYAVVDFDTMAEIVDIIGGVDIEVNDAEAEVLNSYLNSTERAEESLSGGGTYHLDGDQAVAYMRIRYVGNNDYERTQRQRNVLTQIFFSVKNLDAQDLAALAEDVIPCVEHNLNAVELLKLMAALPQFTEYTLEENRIPYDDLYYSQNEMLVPDYEETIARLHEAMYGTAE